MSDKVEELIKKLKAKSKAVRRDAAEALGKLKDPKAVEPLISALKDDRWEVRAAAAWALGEIADERAVGPLVFVSALKDGDKDVS